MVSRRIKEHFKSLIPDNLRLGQLALRRADCWKAAGVIFVHVPKNGGTSINNALYGHFMGHYRVSDIERTRIDLLKKLPSLGVVRNPWARTYSAWSFARKGTQMKDGAQIRNAARYQKAEFQSFERFVLEWLPSRDLNREDYVFRPQMQFLKSRTGKIGVQHLGRIEEPNSYCPYLSEALGRPIRIAHMNRSADPARYREAYSSEMRDMVARCYSVDLERFNYDF